MYTTLLGSLADMKLEIVIYHSGCQVPWKELKHLNVVQAYKEQAMIQQWGVKVGSNIANQEELTTSKPQLPLTLDW